jgi:hypothetical protein
MRNLSIALAVATALTATSAHAQANFEYWPGQTSFTSRGSVSSTTVGEIHTGIHSTINRGLGDTNGVCQITGMFAVIQDQVAATQGTWRYFVRTGTEATGPGVTPADVIANTGTLSVPTSTATGAVAYLFTTNFTTPLAVPCDSFWSAGVELPAGISTDYVSVHTAYNVLNLQHPAAEDISWQILSGAAAATHPGNKRTFRIAPRVAMAMQAGNVSTTVTPNERFSIGGHYPDTTQVGAASQGLVFKVTHPGGALATASVLMATGYNPVAVPIAGFGNSVYLDLASIFPFVVAAGPADGSILAFSPPGRDLLPATAAGLLLSTQAVVIDPATGIDFTNAFGVVLN